MTTIHEILIYELSNPPPQSLDYLFKFEAVQELCKALIGEDCNLQKMLWLFPVTRALLGAYLIEGGGKPLDHQRDGMSAIARGEEAAIYFPELKNPTEPNYFSGRLIWPKSPMPLIEASAELPSP